MTCEKPVADFSVSAAANSFALTKAKGKSNALEIPLQVERVHGFAEAISISVEGLPEHVTAAVVNLSPNYQYENNRRTLDGMQGSRTISVTLRELENYGDFMNAALSSGINAISGVSLDTSKRAQLEDEALDLAIADALERAAHVAKRFSVVLGPVSNVHVQAGHVEPRMMAMSRSADASGGDFSGGEIDIRRDVQATFEILNP